MQLSPEINFVLSAVKIRSTASDIEKLNTLSLTINDWELVSTIAIGRGIGPLVSKKIKLLKEKNQPPAKVRHQLEQSYLLTMGRTLFLQNAYGKIADIFNANTLPFIALKGIYVAEWLYNDPGLRQLSDIDLLIQDKDAPHCISLLESLGYSTHFEGQSDFVKRKMEIIHYPPMHLNGVSIELHIKLHRNTEKYKMDVNELWSKSEKTQLYNRPVTILNFYDFFIFTCLHLDRHFKQGKIQFSGFNDISNIIDLHRTSFNWTELSIRCKTFNCEYEVYNKILLVNKYMDIEIPKDIKDTYKYCLNKQTEEKFLFYLNGSIDYISGIPNHLSSLKSLNSNYDRTKFLWHILFPTKRFLMEKYSNKARIKDQESKKQKEERGKGNLAINLWWLWYFYRWGEGIKGIIILIKRKITHRT